MDKDLIRQHLEQAERHVASGMAVLERQKAVIAKIEAEGFDPDLARDLLAQLEEVQALHVADRDRLIKELGDA